MLKKHLTTTTTTSKMFNIRIHKYSGYRDADDDDDDDGNVSDGNDMIFEMLSACMRVRMHSFRECD